MDDSAVNGTRRLAQQVPCCTAALLQQATALDRRLPLVVYSCVVLLQPLLSLQTLVNHVERTRQAHHTCGPHLQGGVMEGCVGAETRSGAEVNGSGAERAAAGTVLPSSMLYKKLPRHPPCETEL